MRDTRTADWIAKLIPSIFGQQGNVICPVCDGTMKQTEDGYTWKCNTGHCPTDEFRFNERIHNYGVPRY